MARAHRGFGGCIGAGIESVWGTPVARTGWVRAYSLGLERIRTAKAVEHLGDYGEVSTNYKHDYVESDNAGGVVSFPFGFNDTTSLFLKHLFGAVDTSGGPTYTHVFTLASPTLPGLTLEQISGTSNGNGNTAEVFEGCKINRGTISWEAGGIMTFEADIIAQTSQGLVAAGTPSFGTPEWIKHHMMGTFTYNSVARPVKSMKLTINRNLERNHELGSFFTSEPNETAITAMLDVTTLWQQSNWDTEYLADTRAAGSLTFTGTAPHELGVDLNSARIMSVKRNVNSRGAIEQQISMQLFIPTGDSEQGVSFSLINQKATAETP